MKKIKLTFLLFLGSLLLWSGSILPANAATLKGFIPQGILNPDFTLPPEFYEEKFIEYDISLMAVGDNLLHMGIVNTGKQADGSYNYDFLFDEISDFLGTADIKVINQETILGGNEKGFSGYPRFNSPTEVGDAIAKAGFNVVLHASNHAGDKGIDGLLTCVEFWNNYPEVVMTGIHETREDAEEISLITVKGVTFALLNYTYSPNSQTIPASIEGHLDILCEYDSANRIDFTKLNPKVIEDIKKAEELADFVIVFPHWGNEYVTKPSTYQQKFAMEMTAAGADLIIGTHPHVIEPVEWIEAENGNRALCYYSLGNYVSTQKGGPSMLEGLAWVNLRVTENGVVISEKNTGVLPLVCHYKSGPVRMDTVYLLEEYSQELADRHGIRSYGGVNLKYSDLQALSDEVFGNFVITKEEALEN